MKTIQEVIRGMDSEEIEKAYFTDYPDTLNELDADFDDMTVKETRGFLSEQFHRFLSSLLQIEAKPDSDRRGILFLSKRLDSCGLPDMELELAYSDEILVAETINQKTVHSWAFELTPRVEAMSFLVADNKYTQDWLMTVVTKFLYELSFFGYDEAEAVEEAEELDRRVKDAKEHPERLVPVDLDEAWENSGLPKEEVYPKEKGIVDTVIKGIMDYTDYCRTVELERIKKRLIADVEVGL